MASAQTENVLTAINIYFKDSTGQVTCGNETELMLSG